MCRKLSQVQISLLRKNNRHDRRWSCLLSFIFACVVVAFCPVNPLNFLLHFYAIGVWIRSENRWVSFCPVFYKSQCFQASAAFITEAEILMKPARIRRYLISYIHSPHNKKAEGRAAGSAARALRRRAGLRNGAAQPWRNVSVKAYGAVAVPGTISGRRATGAEQQPRRAQYKAVCYGPEELALCQYTGRCSIQRGDL